MSKSCINCEYSIQWDENRQCKRANDNIKECEYFKKKKYYEVKEINYAREKRSN